MATTNEYIEYICEQIKGVGDIRYKKMFGEFMVYVNEKPVIIVCMMENADIGFPYKGAKEHYVLDIDNADFCKEVITKIEKVTPLPKPKKKKE